MNRRPTGHLTAVTRAAGATLIFHAASVASFGAIEFEPTWQIPTYERIRSSVLETVRQPVVDDNAADIIRDQWSEDATDQATSVLDRAAASFALLDQRVADLVLQCHQPFEGPEAPAAGWIGDADLPPLVIATTQLFYGRWLAQHGFYDEALHQLSPLSTAEVVDPAALLFYRMVAHHQLVQPDQALAALVQLLEREEELPMRYRRIAKLVQRDLAALEDESLDHIARRMRDIRRRLDYGRAGERVQQIEQGVVDSLDKLIERAEQQQQQQQQSQAPGSSQSTKPLSESRLAELKAPGRVDQRDIGNQAGWGDLPPKEREQALQQIGREFPAHYREVIQEYFRELAKEDASSAP